MPFKKNESSQEIYQIKITLLYTKPPIWRRLLVPANFTLEQLHHILQITMGWEDYHLHEFRIEDQRFGQSNLEDDFMDLPPVSSERKARLFSVLGHAGAKAIYTYDFGDSWEHNIVVEKILPPVPGDAYPVCVAGKRQGPPEDCGGIPGFYNLLEALANPDCAEHQELREWLGRDFDPDAFSVEDINRELAPLQKRPKHL